MPSPRPFFELASDSHKGRVRQRNEDCVVVNPDRGLAILSDGMGGHRAGDIASRLAVDVITRELENMDATQSTISKQQLVDSLRRANKAMRETANTKYEYEGMGATILVAVFNQDKVVAAHLGDSRLYLYHDDRLIQQTEDHTLAQQYLNEGLISANEAKTWAGRNMLLRALGIQKHIDPEITEIKLETNQIFILCSDGLTDAVSDEQIRGIIKKGIESNRALRHSVDELIELANKNGGPDNISIVLARASQPPESNNA